MGVKCIHTVASLMVTLCHHKHKYADYYMHQATVVYDLLHL